MVAGRDAAIEARLQRIRQTLDEPDPGFPHYADPETGRWVRSPDGDWTGGFWVGQLWLAAAATQDATFRRGATEWMARLPPRLTSKTIFRGFLFWYGAGIGGQLCGDEDAAQLAGQASQALRQLYDPVAGLIPLGDEAEEADNVGRHDTNIDGVPGTIPLFISTARRYSDETLRQLATSHARRHYDMLVRSDGSVIQSATFDAITGEPLLRYTHKGLRADSTWTRAQSWGLLALAHSLLWLSDDFAPLARRVADWWLEHLPDDHVAYWDFDAPRNTQRDTSGTAIAAAGLLKLATVLPERAIAYKRCARAMIDALVSRHLTPIDEHDGRPPGMLLDGCYNRRLGLATRNELVWGDYYLLETLLAEAGSVDATLL